MPVLVRLQRLHKASTLLRLFPVPATHNIGLRQNAINTAGAGRYQVFIHHHVGDPPVAVIGMIQVVIDNRLLLPVFQPVISRYPGIMLVNFAITAFPFKVFTRPNTDPVNQLTRSQLRLA